MVDPHLSRTRAALALVVTGVARFASGDGGPPPTEPGIAPAQTQVVPAPAPPGADDQVHVAAFAHIEWAAILSPIDLGDFIARTSVPPQVSAREWNVGLQPFDYFGATFSDARRGAWHANAQLVLGLYTYRTWRLFHAYAQLVNDDFGFSLLAGRVYHPAANPIEPGTLISAYGYGGTVYSFNGVVIAQRLGRALVQLGIGRPEPVSLGETPPLQGSSGSLYLEPMITIGMPGRTGTLYAHEAGGRVVLCGAVGSQRVGPTDNIKAIDPTAAPSVIEDVTVWFVGTEALVPAGAFTFTASAYVGRGAGYYGAAIFQTARVDPATGAHALLRSAGAWGQIAFHPDSETELLGVIGQDRILDKFVGVDVAGTANIDSNTWAALTATRRLTHAMRVGLQIEYVRSKYDGYPISDHVGGLVSFAYHFGW